MCARPRTGFHIHHWLSSLLITDSYLILWRNVSELLIMIEEIHFFFGWVGRLAESENIILRLLSRHRSKTAHSIQKRRRNDVLPTLRSVISYLRQQIPSVMCQNHVVIIAHPHGVPRVLSSSLWRSLRPPWTYRSDNGEAVHLCDSFCVRVSNGKP